MTAGAVSTSASWVDGGVGSAVAPAYVSEQQICNNINGFSSTSLITMNKVHLPSEKILQVAPIPDGSSPSCPQARELHVDVPWKFQKKCNRVHLLLWQWQSSSTVSCNALGGPDQI